jgi:hypothetical protein
MEKYQVPNLNIRHNERRRRVVKIPDSFSGGPEFKSRLGHRV